MLVQYRLALGLYSILIDLMNAMQACKVVELFLLATMACLTALVERCSSVDWLKCQFLSDVEELVHDRQELCRLPVGTRSWSVS